MSTHSFDVDEAIRFGVEPAILLNNIRFWLQKNRANKSNCHDGFWWTFNSAKAFSELFPYMSRQSITRYLKQLCDSGVLKKSMYNQAGFDRTFWYTIPSEFACKPSENNIAQNELSIAQNELSIAQNKATIPDINTDITTDMYCVVSASEEKISLIENNDSQQPEQIKKQSITKAPTTSMEWVSYFVNQQGFQIHEAQTSKTVPMYVEWVKQGYTLEDVEMGIMGAMGWLSQSGKTRANSPCLFDGFIKTAITARQSIQAQKSPAVVTSNTQGSNIIPFNGENYDTRNQYQQPQRKLSANERALEATRRGLERIEREEREAQIARQNDDSVVATHDVHLWA